MAIIDEKIAQELAPKQLARLEELAALVEDAEASKDQPTPVADFVKAAASFLNASEVDEAAALAIADVMRKCDGGMDKSVKFADDAIARVRLLVDALAPRVETVDRLRGDLVASALEAMVKGDSLEDAAVPVVVDLVARWQATAPKRSGGGSGSGDTPANLGFRVTTHCDVPGCGWTSYTDKNNHNSARHQAIVHARTVHGVELSPRKGGDAVAFKKLSEAFSDVGLESDGTATVAQAANFTVKRAA
jgi:hypothetical protein